jgi:dTDP-4-amino-4,6-dideoxygalactose transaminase
VNSKSSPAIPFQNLYTANRLIEGEFLKEFARLFKRGEFIGGQEVAAFETEFSRAASQGFQSSHAIALSSGTTALHLALMAAGVGPGDEVILPAFTFPGTAWGVLYQGAIPRFADVSATTAQIDPESVARLINRKTKAIIAVHLFGHPAPIPALKRLVRGKRIALIEDAAQAHGGNLNGAALGTLGDFGCFSFYPTKNLGGMGEGGLVLTRSEKQAKALRRWRDQGGTRAFLPETVGFNARLDSAKALFLRLKLPHLSQWNAQRKKAADLYLQTLKGSKVTPLLPAEGESAWHAFVIKVSKRVEMQAALDQVGLPSRVYYPKALPDLKPFSQSRDPIPHSREWAKKALALPLYPGLSKEAAKRLSQVLK